MLTDNELMEQFRECSIEAYIEIYTRYQRRLLNFSYGILRDYNACQDIVQKSLIKVFEYKLLYQPTNQFSTWIFTIAKNLAINELNYRKQTENLSDEYQDDSFDHDLISDYIRKKISDLPEAYVNVIIARYVEGYSFQEIAEQTGININTLKSHAKRGLEQLKNIIDEDDSKKKNI